MRSEAGRLVADDAYVYWAWGWSDQGVTIGGGIRRTTTGATPEVRDEVGSPALAFAPGAGGVAWVSDAQPAPSRLFFSDASRDVRPLAASAAVDPIAYGALRVSGDFVFWATHAGEVFRAPLDGGPMERLAALGPVQVDAVAVLGSVVLVGARRFEPRGPRSARRDLGGALVAIENGAVRTLAEQSAGDWISSIVITPRRELVWLVSRSTPSAPARLFRQPTLAGVPALALEGPYAERVVSSGDRLVLLRQTRPGVSTEGVLVERTLGDAPERELASAWSTDFVATATHVCWRDDARLDCVAL